MMHEVPAPALAQLQHLKTSGELTPNAHFCASQMRRSGVNASEAAGKAVGRFRSSHAGRSPATRPTGESARAAEGKRSTFRNRAVSPAPQPHGAAGFRIVKLTDVSTVFDSVSQMVPCTQYLAANSSRMALFVGIFRWP